jgi:sRNA-binding carbon storage regulator CsrA
MLIVNRRKGEQVRIRDVKGNEVTLTIAKVTPSKVILHFTPSDRILVNRIDVAEGSEK